MIATTNELYRKVSAWNEGWFDCNEFLFWSYEAKSVINKHWRFKWPQWDTKDFCKKCFFQSKWCFEGYHSRLSWDKGSITHFHFWTVRSLYSVLQILSLWTLFFITFRYFFMVFTNFANINSIFFCLAMRLTNVIFMIINNGDLHSKYLWYIIISGGS